MIEEPFVVAAISGIRSAGTTLNAAESLERTRARDPEAAALLEAFARDHPDTDRTTHPIRQHFGIRAFGVNAFSASAGQPLIVPHSERRYGHEELYVVLDGRVRARCDGSEFDVERGTMLFVRPHVHRALTALDTPTIILAVGAVAGQPYAPPSWATDGGGSRLN